MESAGASPAAGAVPPPRPASAVDLAALAAQVPDSVVDAVRGGRRVLAVGHENPDADTLGSTLAVCMLVEALGGVATPVCSDPVPSLYAFVPGIDRFRTDPDPAIAYDLLVVSDCGSLDRVGDVRTRHADLLARLPRVLIDHHASNDDGGAADWIDPSSAATCEMVTLLAVRLGIPLDVEDGAMATALMSGLVMDTATFAHPNTTPQTLAVAAALVDAGAPLSEISRRIYRTKPDQQLRLFGRVLGRLESAMDGRIVWSTLLEEDLVATGAPSSHSEGIIDLLAQAEDADVAILFKEKETATRVSVRTRPGGIDATVLTGRFGGGGHARAAGASVDLPVEQARTAVLAEARRLVESLGR
jgi:bifunctional oligoribonuclease and PAP phosphatase NrnA